MQQTNWIEELINFTKTFNMKPLNVAFIIDIQIPWSMDITPDWCPLKKEPITISYETT